MANPHADLGALTVSRSAPDAPELRLPRRWWSRVLLPLALVAGFAALALWASWDLVAPPVAVKVVPVRVQTGTVEMVGQELFRANGWVEPLPRPTDVPVQTEGMYRVERVLVNPGDRVGKGKELVVLGTARAELDREVAAVTTVVVRARTWFRRAGGGRGGRGTRRRARSGVAGRRARPVRDRSRVRARWSAGVRGRACRAG